MAEGGGVQLCGSNLSLADTDTSVAGGVHLPCTYNALSVLLLPTGFPNLLTRDYQASKFSL
jgi:hypothetical protein